VFVSINGKRMYLWRAVDSEGEVLDIHESMELDSLESISNMVFNKLGVSIDRSERRRKGLARGLAKGL